MKYANEFVLLWYMVMCSFIVLTNPDSHIAFIGIHVAVVGLYKWMEGKENGKVPKQQV